VPGRFALYTGRYAHSVRTIRYPAASEAFSVTQRQAGSEAGGGPARRPGLAALSVRERTLGHHFGAAGYVTGFVGKFHPVAPHTHGFDYYVDFGHYQDYLGPRHETFARGMLAVDSGCGVPWIDVVHEGRGSPWRDAALGGDRPSVFSDEADHPEGFFAREAIRFLEAYRDEPFALVVSFLRPHAPWAAAPRYRAQYDPERLGLPPEPAVPMGDDASLPEAVRAHGRRFWQPHQTWPIPPPGDPARGAAARQWLAAYYACVTQMDAAAGAVLDTLNRLDLRDQTLVLYTSDHGEMAGEHGVYQKFVFYEGAARVPLLARCPWAPVAGGASGAPIDLADVVPTCLELCGVEAASGCEAIEGRSFAATLFGHGEGEGNTGRAGNAGSAAQASQTAGKGFAFGEITYAAGPAYMIRRGPWKYAHYTGTGERSLFDLEHDPGEERNLAGRPAAAGAEASLRDRLFEWLPAHLPQ
jgi:choline-sulfatase